MTAGASPSVRLWRVFQWDSDAEPGHPFSADFIPPRQGSGRFDLAGRPPVLYLAESPVHAIGEKLQRYRGQELDWPDLREFGRPLAVVEVVIEIATTTSVVDLCDPANLLKYGCRPDELMSRDVTRTQALSRRLHDQGLAGFTLWSALTGDWHSTVLFTDRITAQGRMTFGTPEALDLNSSAVQDAARILAISIAGR